MILSFIDFGHWLAFTIIMLSVTSEVLYASKLFKNALIPKQTLRFSEIILIIIFIMVIFKSL